MEREITIELPPGDPIKIDFDKLRELITKAATRSRELLIGTPVENRPYVIYRGNEKSISGIWESLPDYRCKAVWDKIDEIWNNEAVQELTEYLWSHNAFKKKITGPSPDKSAWARFVFGDLVHFPLLHALKRTAIENTTDGKLINEWEIPNDQLRNAIENIIDNYKDSVNKIWVLKAVCFLPGLSLPDHVTDFGEGIGISKLPLRDRCIFLTDYNDLYTWDLFKAPFFHDHLLEIRITLPLDSKSSPQNIIADKLDLLKWGLLIASKAETVPSEGPCLVLDRIGNVVFKFRRDVSDFHSSVILKDLEVSECRKLLEEFKGASTKTEELKQALTHFGRACLANINRDILLEAAIGIDSLVSIRGGDSRYRFCLHGAAVLATIDNKNEYELLKKIYDKRSTAAHGASTAADRELALQTRGKLATVIQAVMKLILENKLDLSKGKIANAIEYYVIKKAAE